MEISELVRNLLAKRGIADAKGIDAFLHPDYEAHLHDPMLLSGMRPALDRLFEALEREEKIAMVGRFLRSGLMARRKRVAAAGAGSDPSR